MVPSAERERYIVDLVEDAVAPYGRFLSAEAMAHLRDVVRLTLRTHPTAVRLVEEVAPRGDVLQSGDLPKDDAPVAPARQRMAAVRGKRVGRG